MNSENIKKVTNQAIEQLIEALKAGKSEALTNYLAAVANFHRYSFQNILLIARQCPQATQRVRETEAEAVAFVVNQGIGLDTNSAAQDYISLYSGDAALLLESLEYIQQTANQILNSIGTGESSGPPAN